MAPHTAAPHVTLPEAARRLRYSYRRTYDLVLTGQLHATCHNGRWAVSARDVERLARELERNERAEGGAA